MNKITDFSDLSQALVDKTLTKQGLLKTVRQDFSMIPLLLTGVGSPKAAVRYGCAKVLMDLSEDYPEKLYPHMDVFVDMLDSKYRIIIWNALAILANLTRVDADKKFDAIFDKYYSFLDHDYMVTVANVVGNSAKIALAKPYLISGITDELLKVQHLSLTPHLTEECKRVIAQQTIKSFDLFFDQISQKENVLSFVKIHLDSPREKLRLAAEIFVKKWGNSF
ncbi:MAG: hypothetical protein NWF06_08860 [Candidatus Bathyarchaeota archaeon]|nr:hypothetical protein [Candidatus Bathyarchaeum sp.]